MISENIVDIKPSNSDQVCLDLVTIEKYDTTGPRYTSYHTAVEFHEGIDCEDYKRAAKDANDALLPSDLSLYFHLPFCRHLCFYCGCNKIVTKNQQKSDKYLDGEVLVQLKTASDIDRLLSDYSAFGLMKKRTVSKKSKFLF